MGRIRGTARQSVVVGDVMIRITAKKDGFRRAGISHAGTRDYPDGRFTPEELAALKAEPMLVVEEITVPKKEKAPAKEPEHSTLSGKKKTEA